MKTEKDSVKQQNNEPAADKKKGVVKYVRKLRAKITFNVIFGVVSLLLIFSIIAITIGYWQFSERLTEQYTDNAVLLAKAAEVYLDEDTINDFLGNDDDSGLSYESLLASLFLEQLCGQFNADTIYVVQPDSDDFSRVKYVIRVYGNTDDFEEGTDVVVKEVNSDYQKKFKKIFEDKSEKEIIINDKGYFESGSNVVAMIPMRNADNKIIAVICVQQRMDGLTTSRVKFTVRVFIALVILVIIAAIAYGLYLNRSLIRPIKIITNETARFSVEPSQAEKPLADMIKSRDEIGVLANSVDMLESETLSYIENLTKVTAETQRIGVELDLAARIQQNMLNTVFPEHDVFDLYASMTPAKEVGGDFYDFFMVDDNHLCLVIADVSGKGVPASLFMTVTKTILADTARACSSPAETLRLTNERICKGNKIDMFVSVWMGILELSTGKVTAANAGHEYPVIYRKGGAFELMRDKHGFVIGGLKDISYKDYDFTLGEGDALFVYTDGLPEAADNDEQLFGIDRMLAALNIEPDSAPCDLLPKVKSEVDAFVGDSPQSDDLTMMCVKYHGS